MSLDDILRRVLPVAAAGALLVTAGPAAADPGAAAFAEAAKSPAKVRSLPRRHGGAVRKAWPDRRKAARPAPGLARFLARQVGPVKVRRSRGRARASVAAVTTPLALVRSYAIPADDPSAQRLANLSWTYDSAIAAIAFAGDGDRGQAQQLLDQLAALQRVDGSIDFAFNVATGSSVPLFRSGSMAEIGLAGAVYRNVFRSSRYDTLTAGAARWLLARQQPSGLIAGGPDVTWASTQHNLLAYFFLASLAQAPPEGYTAAQLNAAADRIGDALEGQLLVPVSSSQSAFVQGTGDTLRPLDAQTLGTMFLLIRGQWVSAAKVRAYIAAAYPVGGRTIALSNATDTFNGTYAASGPFSGYRPYATDGPDVLWAEGTAQVAYLQKLIGESTKDADKAMDKWNAVTGKQGLGPLGADRTVTGHAVNEYHVWPTSAAASWSLIAESASDLGFGDGDDD